MVPLQEDEVIEGYGRGLRASGQAAREGWRLVQDGGWRCVMHRGAWRRVLLEGGGWRRRMVRVRSRGVRVCVCVGVGMGLGRVWPRVRVLHSCCTLPANCVVRLSGRVRLWLWLVLSLELGLGLGRGVRVWVRVLVRGRCPQAFQGPPHRRPGAGHKLLQDLHRRLQGLATLPNRCDLRQQALQVRGGLGVKRRGGWCMAAVAVTTAGARRVLPRPRLPAPTATTTMHGFPRPCSKLECGVQQGRGGNLRGGGGAGGPLNAAGTRWACHGHSLAQRGCAPCHRFPALPHAAGGTTPTGGDREGWCPPCGQRRCAWARGT